MVQDSKSINVLLEGNAVNDKGESVSLEKKFVFDIENASPDKLPIWVNENETVGEFKEYWDYIHTLGSEMPEWLAERLE